MVKYESLSNRSVLVLLAEICLFSKGLKNVVALAVLAGCG